MQVVIDTERTEYWQRLYIQIELRRLLKGVFGSAFEVKYITGVSDAPMPQELRDYVRKKGEAVKVGETS